MVNVPKQIFKIKLITCLKCDVKFATRKRGQVQHSGCGTRIKVVRERNDC